MILALRHRKVNSPGKNANLAADKEIRAETLFFPSQIATAQIKYFW